MKDVLYFSQKSSRISTPHNNYLVRTLVGRSGHQSSLVLDDLVDGAADAPPAPAAAVPQGEDGGRRTQPTTLLLMLNSWWQRFTVIKVLEGFCFWLNFVQCGSEPP